MRDIVYIRLDDRLVHGQIVAVWLNDMKCDVLCVIDDKAATNSLQQMLLRMTVPKSTNFELLTVEEGAKYLLEEIDEKIFLIVGEIETITRLVDLGVPIKEVNLGNLGNRSDRKQYTKAIWLSDTEKQEIEKLVARDIEVNVHLVPNEKKFSALEALK